MLCNNVEYLAEGQTFHGSVPLVMGTRLEVIVVGYPKDAMESLWNWACVEAEALDAILNRFNPESEISRLNRTASVKGQHPSSLLVRLIGIAKEYHDRTFGLFDVTKGWMDEVLLDSSGVLSLSGHELDFGGLAKGYFLREFKERLSLFDVKSAFLDFGGSSIATIGHHPYGDCWKVGIRNPFTNLILSEVELVDRSMSTSGNSPRYSSHIINPFTKESVDGRKVVTVLSDDPLDAEVLSTALMVADDEQTELLQEAFPDVELMVFEP